MRSFAYTRVRHLFSEIPCSRNVWAWSANRNYKPGELLESSSVCLGDHGSSSSNNFDAPAQKTAPGMKNPVSSSVQKNES